MPRPPKKTAEQPKLEIDRALGKEATGSDNLEFSMRMLRQVGSTNWIPEGSASEDQIELARASFAMLKGIAPTDEMEGMLAAQMVATHNAALECFRRAMIPSQTFGGRDNNLKNGAKLAALYARQMDALNKHRGKGQQKVTVEHVHVEAGGQAIVGNIENNKAPAQNSAQHQRAPKPITYSEEKIFDAVATTQKVAVRRRKS